MADPQPPSPPSKGGTVRPALLEEEMKDSYLNYAMSVIVSRALPDVRDGLKPSQRRILYAMNELGLGPRSKTRKCATIVGETTGGGAHPTRGFRVTDHFGVGVPFARSINPVTKTNWEGTGVKPDVAVPADQALATAKLLILKKSLEKYGKEPEEVAYLKRAIADTEKELDAVKGKEKAAK